MSGLYDGVKPAIVRSYDKETRTCRVEIMGITDGGDHMIEAEICYPIGDKSRIKEGTIPTEIEMLPDDMVWVQFINGDQNHPLIMGYRCPRVGNDVDTRRYHHKNVQLIADELMAFNAKNLAALIAENITITADGDMTLTIKGNVAINSGTLKHNGKNVGDTHTHGNVQSGSSNTGNPV